MSKMNIKMADITTVRKKIDAVIPLWGSSRNPVDIVGDADFNRFNNVLDRVLAHPKSWFGNFYVYSFWNFRLR
jgi:Acyl-CoA synthetase (NDP forming)